MRTTRRSLLSSAAAAAASLAAPSLGLALGRPVVGITLPLTGVQAVPAREMKVGYEAALSRVADIKFLDDESNADKVAAHMAAFADSDVIATSGIVGTPHAKKGLPVAIKGGLPVVGIRSGASELRNGNPLVFHLRASYEDEISEILKLGPLYQPIAVLYSDDDFGKASYAHAKKVAEGAGIKIQSALPVERNGSNVRQQAAALAAKQPVGAYLLCLIAKPAQEATTELRLNQKVVAPIWGMSFIGTSQLALSTEPQYESISLVSPFPLARVDVRDLPSTFRSQMMALKHEELISSPSSFEAYFYGSVLAEAIERGGPSRKAVQAYLNTSRPIDVKQIEVKFDSLRVGYRYLALLRKVGTSFRA